MATTEIDETNEGTSESVPGTDVVEVHRIMRGDPEKLESTTSPDLKRRQPFSAVWVVIACGFALMSDGLFTLSPFPDIQLTLRISQLCRRNSKYYPRSHLSRYLPALQLFQKHHFNSICRNCFRAIIIRIHE